MGSKVPARSAGYVGWGFLLLIAGSIGAAIGLANPSGGIFTEPRTSPLAYGGAAISLLGLVILAIGVHTMAQALDALVQRSTGSIEVRTASPAAAPEEEQP